MCRLQPPPWTLSCYALANLVQLLQIVTRQNIMTKAVLEPMFLGRAELPVITLATSDLARSRESPGKTRILAGLSSVSLILPSIVQWHHKLHHGNITKRKGTHRYIPKHNVIATVQEYPHNWFSEWGVLQWKLWISPSLLKSSSLTTANPKFRALPSNKSSTRWCFSTSDPCNRLLFPKLKLCADSADPFVQGGVNRRAWIL